MRSQRLLHVLASQRREFQVDGRCLPQLRDQATPLNSQLVALGFEAENNNRGLHRTAQNCGSAIEASATRKLHGDSLIECSFGNVGH
jgi:hypothetical protein